MFALLGKLFNFCDRKSRYSYYKKPYSLWSLIFKFIMFCERKDAENYKKRLIALDDSYSGNGGLFKRTRAAVKEKRARGCKPSNASAFIREYGFYYKPDLQKSKLRSIIDWILSIFKTSLNRREKIQ